MTKKSKRDELFDLADNVVDTILNMSDEELDAELEREGIAPEDAVKAFDSLVDSARMKAGQKSLLRAREKLNADKLSARSGRSRSAAEARALVERAAKELPQMTQAARNAQSGVMSDDDVFDLLDDLEELGFSFHGEAET
jgi:hypothetical protein